MLLLALVSLTGSAQKLADLYEKVAPSVVTIYAAEVKNAGVGDPMVQTSSLGMGTGFLINSEGYIVTAAHVVGNAEDLNVEFLDGENIPAKTVNISRMDDVAVIKLLRLPENPVYAKVGDSDKVRVGDPIFVVGAPLGLKHSLSTGIISGRHKDMTLGQNGAGTEFLQTDAAINHGNSGGPMFNYNGEVVGIVSSILSFSGGFEGLGFAATVNAAKEQLRRKSSRYFGVDGIFLSYELARVLNVPQESGILVQSVIKGTQAYFTGLKGGYMTINVGELEIMAGGDVILAVDDIQLTSVEKYKEMLDYLDNDPKKNTHKIKVLRDGQITELTWFQQE